MELIVYLPIIANIPPTMPSTKPTIKPPPIISEIIATGKTITEPIVSYPIIIRTDPMHVITPNIMPTANSTHGGKAPK